MDKPSALKKRMKFYKENTEKVIKYYKKKFRFFEINGNQPIKKVFNDIKSILDKIR